MLLSSRLVTFQALPGDVLPAATAICDRVKEVGDVDVTLWAAGPGYPVGTFAWSSVAESHAHYGDVQAKVVADAKYLELVSQLLPHAVGQGQQILRELVFAPSVPEGPPPLGSVAWLVAGQIANGQMASGMAWAVEMAQLATAISGSDVALFRDLYGPWGTVTWLTGFENMAAIDDANAKLGASEEYMAKLDSGGDLFVSGGVKSGIVTRVH